MNPQKILNLCEKITQSKEFANSDSSVKLLKYLVDAYAKGVVPKETTIAIEVFNRKTDFDSATDSIVRVQVHNLRRKLDKYYRRNGKQDPVQISIPTGHYKIEIIEEPAASNESLRKIIWAACAVSISLNLLLAGIIFFTRDNTKISKNNAIWQPFFKSKRQNIIVLGDYYYITAKSPDHYFFIRSTKINSDEDLEKYDLAPLFPRMKLGKTTLTYLTKHGSWCLFDMLFSLPFQKKQLQLKLSSDIEVDDIRNNNLIYIGSYKTMGKLQHITANLHFDFHAYDRLMTFKVLKEDTTLQYRGQIRNSPQLSEDYCLVVKMAGPAGNTILLFLTNHDIGNIATVQYFSQLQSLKKFEKEHLRPENIEYFEALFHVQGFQRSELKAELLYLNKLEPDFFQKQPSVNSGG